MTIQRHQYVKILPNNNQVIYNENPPKWRCTACSKLSLMQNLRNGLENGLELSGFSGYYGGFTDQSNQDSISEYEAYNNAYFCHACCVKLFKTFPALAINVGINKSWGHHPCEDDQPCCDYAWKLHSVNDVSYYTTVLTAARDEDNHLYWKEQKL